jgi:hypothetical protein
MKTAYSPAAMLLRGALFAYLLPRLADYRSCGVMLVDNAVKGLTSRNFRYRRQALIAILDHLAKPLLAPGETLADLPALLAFLQPEIEHADRLTLTLVTTGEDRRQPARPRPANEVDIMPSKEIDLMPQLKAYLTAEGVAPEIIDSLDAWLREIP